MASLRNHFEVERAGISESPERRAGYPLRESLALVEGFLEGLDFSQNPQFAGLTGAMRRALSRKGKRVRAVLCLEVARSFGSDPASVLPSAAAVELIHAASLIHDDLLLLSQEEDGSRPDEALDDATAILAGDALFSESVALISIRQKGTARQLLDVVGELAAVTGVRGLMGGQALSIAGRDGRKTDPETLKATHAYRTGALIEASARVGAILAGASEAEKEHVSEYARKLGLCLRITSDLPAATSEDSGEEPSGKDSFVGVYGLSEARRLASEASREALEVLERLDADTRGLAEMVHLAHFQKTPSVG